CGRAGRTRGSAPGGRRRRARRPAARTSCPSSASAASSRSRDGLRRAGREPLSQSQTHPAAMIEVDTVPPSAVALIPARAGSQRVPGKNLLPLGGHPLIAYSIGAARASGLFGAVLVSTDSREIAEVAGRYGAEVPGLRPAELATATSPDIDWVVETMRGRD